MTSKSYQSGKIDRFQLEDLKESEKSIGQIYPVLMNSQGEIIDGRHRKRVKPDWKELQLPVNPGIDTLRLRVHLNMMRRDIERDEKSQWISETRTLLQFQGKKGTQKEIAEALGVKRTWVEKYNPTPQVRKKNDTACHFYGYNVWGFKDESWRELIVKDDPNQSDVESYHGKTPTFVIHNLLKIFEPKSVLDTMAGIGTTKYVCDQYGIPCRQFDLYPFPKNQVEQGDAESIATNETFDLIFNHIPYLGMVKYGESPEDLSIMQPGQFYQKLEHIFQRNRSLLNTNGIYAILVGDWRHEGHLEPITAKTIEIGLSNGLLLKDCAIKLTGEMESKTLQEYRATKFGYLAQTYDTVLMFKREER